MTEPKSHHIAQRIEANQFAEKEYFTDGWVTLRPICHQDAHWTIHHLMKGKKFTFRCSVCRKDHFSVTVL